jgi:hypothetical protein
MNDNEQMFDDLYGSKYLCAADLHGEQIRRKIGKVEIEELKEKDGGTKRKFVIYFLNVDKPLVVNKTNANKLAAAHGKNTANWRGVVCEIYAEMTSLGKEGVRLRPIKAAGELNDDIPPLS